MQRVIAFIAAGVFAIAAPAAAQTQFPADVGDPEVLPQCQRAPSLVLRTICDNRDLAGLERDIQRYVRLIKRRDPARAAEIDAAQLAFERQRETACGRQAAPQDYDGPAYRCLRLQQRTRLVQLAAQATGPASGLFFARRPDMSGELAIVEWPDGRAQVSIDTLTPPDARTCSIQFTAPAGPALAGTPQGAPGCRVSVDAVGRNATVRSEGDCSAVCVLNGRPDGLYRR